MDLIKEAFIEGYKQRAENSDLIFDNASKMYAIALFNKWHKEQLILSGVVKSFCECTDNPIKIEMTVSRCASCCEIVKD